MWEWMGQGLEDVARNETEWDRETGKVKRGFFENIGDKIRGYSNEDISKARQDIEAKGNRQSRAGKKLTRMAKENPNLGIELDTLGWESTGDDILAAVTKAEQIKRAQDTYLYQGGDASALADKGFGTNVPLVLKAGEKAEKEAARNTPEAIKARTRDDQSWQMLIDDRAQRTEDNRLNRLDRAEDRRRDYMLRLDDLDMRRQQEANKMDIYRQQLANQRADRKQAQMMALIQGLATLGSGFAL